MTQNTINNICQIVKEAHDNAGKLGPNVKLGKVPAELRFHIDVMNNGNWKLTEKGVRTVRIANV